MKCLLLNVIGIFLFSSIALAAELPYLDVPPGIWYEVYVSGFLEEGYLDKNQERFRAADRASRAEFAKLIIELSGGVLDEMPNKSSFSDVSVDAWYFPYLEESAREGWIRGDGDCRGEDVCYVRPGDPITRAEAATLYKRSFGKKSVGLAPAFIDNPAGTWYADSVQTMADHCIFQGDQGTRNVRPLDFLNRAEMVVMLSRDIGSTYPDC